MLRYAFLALAVLALMLGSAPSAAAQLRLARLFGDGMVMQRDAAVPVWGWAAPGAEVAVRFDGRTHTARAGADGAWRVALPPLPAGGPHEMTVAAGGERRTVRDILVGDVWVASGQSNMEWPLSAARDAEREIAAADDRKIRHFKVPQSWAERPEAELAGGEWKVATPEQVGDFSAVGYFFARDLRRSVDVPIGIINSSWGGSRAEPWMSREALGIDERRWEEMQARERARMQAMMDSVRARIGGMPDRDAGMVEGRAVWAAPSLDDAGWARIPVPGLWEQAGYPAMDGSAWYRTEFTLTAGQAKREVRLGLGMIDDDDVTWVNGVEVGRTSGYDRPRRYTVPASALRPGRNVIAVRVEDAQGGGGIYGPADSVFVEIGGVRRALPAQWKFRVGAVSVKPDGQQINKVPTLLFNKMIHPLLPYPITGVIWYQGESNADQLADAAAYRDVFQGLIRDWRGRWNRGDFPFLYVQLANFMAADAEPQAQSNWATLRESQTAALGLPNTAQAVAIDIGEAGDIHPRNKQDVGRRLALAARKVAYGQDVVHSGPAYRRHEIRNGRVIVEMDHVGGGLVAGGGGNRVKGFAIAGADGRWVWADAEIRDGRVVVWSEGVVAPVAVRYAWANNPAGANLYNREGLPAAPFRTDRW